MTDFAGREKTLALSKDSDGREFFEFVKVEKKAVDEKATKCHYVARIDKHERLLTPLERGPSSLHHSLRVSEEQTKAAVKRLETLTNYSPKKLVSEILQDDLVYEALNMDFDRESVARDLEGFLKGSSTPSNGSFQEILNSYEDVFGVVPELDVE